MGILLAAYDAAAPPHLEGWGGGSWRDGVHRRTVQCARHALNYNLRATRRQKDRPWDEDDASSGH